MTNEVSTIEHPFPEQCTSAPANAHGLFGVVYGETEYSPLKRELRVV